MRKYINLALKNNPNIIELIFTAQDKIQFVNPYGQMILDNKDIFLSQLSRKTFLSYAISQKHKMIIKEENLLALHEGLKQLKGLDDHAALVEVIINHPFGPVASHFVLQKGTQHIKCGDIHFERGLQVKKARRMIESRLGKSSWRAEGMLKHKYEPKFASHLIRLLYECKQILSEGTLSFPLKERDLILDIKQGKYTLDQVLELSEQIEDEIKLIKSALPEIANYKKAEELTMTILKDNFY